MKSEDKKKAQILRFFYVLILCLAPRKKFHISKNKGLMSTTKRLPSGYLCVLRIDPRGVSPLTGAIPLPLSLTCRANSAGPLRDTTPVSPDKGRLRLKVCTRSFTHASFKLRLCLSPCHWPRSARFPRPSAEHALTRAQGKKMASEDIL